MFSGCFSTLAELGLPDSKNSAFPRFPASHVRAADSQRPIAEQQFDNRRLYLSELPRPSEEEREQIPVAAPGLRLGRPSLLPKPGRTHHHGSRGNANQTWAISVKPVAAANGGVGATGGCGSRAQDGGSEWRAPSEQEAHPTQTMDDHGVRFAAPPLGVDQTLLLP
jgi:hypothetical protein